MRPAFSRLPAALRRFAADRRGAAAVELALTAPAMLAVLGLASICGESLAIAQKVTATSRTLTDIVTRNTSLASSDLQTIIGAASATMTPYDTANLSMVVSEVYVDGNGAATVVWSRAGFNGVALTKGQTVTLAPGSYQNSSYYILGSVSYSYTPLNIVLPVVGAITLSDQTLWAPRVTANVALTN